MKKKIVILLLLASILVACTNKEVPSSNLSFENFSDGTTVFHDDRSDTYMVNTTPYNLKYNEDVFPLEYISAYQNISNHEYYIYIALKFDFSCLSDDAYHWLMEDQQSALPTFDNSIYLSSKSNNIERKKMSRLYYSYDRNSAVCIFFLIDGQKNDFSDLDLDINIQIKQNETYVTSSGDEGNRTIYYYFNTNNGLNVPVVDLSEAPDDIYSDIILGYDRLGKTLESLQ